MARSISTTSGRSRCAKWTAWAPLSASPTTSRAGSRSRSARSPRRTTSWSSAIRKGKVERPFFYLEQQFIKGTHFASFSHFLEELAVFERDDLDVRVHSTTLERPIDRFQQELPHLTPLPEQRFVGTLALSRKVSWDCLVSYDGSRYSVPATQAGKLVWLLPSRGTHVLVLDARREVLVQHRLSDVKGAIVILPEHYAPLRRTAARTYVVLAGQFLERFPHQAAFLDGLVAQHKMNPADHLRGVMELASLYDTGSLERAFAIAQEYNTYSHGFVRGLLESTTQPEVDELATASCASSIMANTVSCRSSVFCVSVIWL